MTNRNWDKAHRRGKPTEALHKPKAERFTPAEPASPGRSLDPEEVARIAAERGLDTRKRP